MATITSRAPALLGYLVTLFTNAPSLAAVSMGGSSYAVKVYDGPPTTEEDPQLKLYIGLSDPDNPGGEAAADTVQAWAAIGRLARDETVTIHCCAEAWSGSDQVSQVRAAAAAIVAAVESLMQADTTQFGGNVLFPDPGLTNTAWPQNNTTKGAIARVTFDLAFRCRIGGF